MWKSVLLYMKGPRFTESSRKLAGSIWPYVELLKCTVALISKDWGFRRKSHISEPIMIDSLYVAVKTEKRKHGECTLAQTVLVVHCNLIIIASRYKEQVKKPRSKTSLTPVYFTVSRIHFVS